MCLGVSHAGSGHDIPHRTDRETASGKAQRYDTDLKLIYINIYINLYTSYHSIHDENDNLESTATSNPSGTTDAVFTKLPRPLAKDRKNTLANSRSI